MKLREPVSYGGLVGQEGMASPARAHPTVRMEQAEQAGRGQPSTARSPGHQASPWVMRQVWGRAGKLVRESESVQGPQPSMGMGMMWLQCRLLGTPGV